MTQLCGACRLVRKRGSSDVYVLTDKLRRRGLSFGILVAANGITGDPVRRTAAHATIAGALTEQRKLIVRTVDEIKTFTIKRKLSANSRSLGPSSLRKGNIFLEVSLASQVGFEHNISLPQRRAISVLCNSPAAFRSSTRGRSHSEKKYLPCISNNIAAIFGLPLDIACYARSRR